MATQVYNIMKALQIISSKSYSGKCGLLFDEVHVLIGLCLESLLAYTPTNYNMFARFHYYNQAHLYKYFV